MNVDKDNTIRIRVQQHEEKKTEWKGSQFNIYERSVNYVSRAVRLPTYADLDQVSPQLALDMANIHLLPCPTQVPASYLLSM